jgi:hypothetical protein
VPGIATNVLGDCLQLLQQAWLVRRATLLPPAASAVCELTDRGRQLKPVLLALAGWGLPLLGRPCDLDAYRSAGWFWPWSSASTPSAARRVELTWELRVDDKVLHVNIQNGTTQTLQGPAQPLSWCWRPTRSSSWPGAAGSWTTSTRWPPAFG